MKTKIFHTVTFVFVTAIFVSCNSTSEKDGSYFETNIRSKTIPSPQNNPLTKEGVSLGRDLFFDPNLSKNGTVSCATCHEPSRAFTDGLSLSSKGVSGQNLIRNAPTLTNIAWQKTLFHDGGSKDLEFQVLGPLTHQDEMGAKVADVINYLSNDPSYVNKFMHAFGTKKIETKHFIRAIAQFERTLVSNDSKYDRFLRNELSLSAEELKGLKAFEKKCQSCHSGKDFTDHSFHNTGLDSNFVWRGEGHTMGRFRISTDSADIGKYKTPTLRNITLTAPYMHDGRFNTLEEVLSHYNNPIKSSINIDQRLLKTSLSKEEQNSLIQFLSSLTDEQFTQTNYKNIIY